MGASFALGFGAVGPYLALRQPRPEPISRSELGFFSRYATESRLYAVGVVAGGPDGGERPLPPLADSSVFTPPQS